MPTRPFTATELREAMLFAEFADAMDDSDSDADSDDEDLVDDLLFHSLEIFAPSLRQEIGPEYLSLASI